jgi:hypothetical protein
VPILPHRAVSAAELADILSSGEYRLVPGGVEGKYFCLSLDDARYFRDQALLDHGIFDRRPGAFANLGTLPMVNSDARRFGGIRRLE